MTTDTGRKAALGDPGRLAALERAGIDDSEPNQVLQWLTELTTRLLDTPVALVSLVDRDRQVFCAAAGLDLRQTPLSHSFCQHVVAREDVFVVPDANEEPLVSGNLAIENLGVVAYAGVPLVDRDGYTLGSFCAIDHVPREWRPEDVDLLSGLARVAVAELGRRSALAELAAREADLRRERELLALAAAGLGGPVAIASIEGRIVRVVGDTTTAWGVPAESLIGRLAPEALPGFPGGALLSVERGERPSGIRGGSWSVLPRHDENQTAVDLVIVRLHGAAAPPAPPASSDAPVLSEAVLGWVGLLADDFAGLPVGRVEGLVAGADTTWLLVRLSGGRDVLVPAAGAVAGSGRLAVSHAAEQIAASPAIERGHVEAGAAAAAAHYGLDPPNGSLQVVVRDVT